MQRSNRIRLEDLTRRLQELADTRRRRSHPSTASALYLRHVRPIGSPNESDDGAEQFRQGTVPIGYEQGFVIKFTDIFVPKPRDVLEENRIASLPIHLQIGHLIHLSRLWPAHCSAVEIYKHTHWKIGRLVYHLAEWQDLASRKNINIGDLSSPVAWVQ